MQYRYLRSLFLLCFKNIYPKSLDIKNKCLPLHQFIDRLTTTKLHKGLYYTIVLILAMATKNTTTEKVVLDTTISAAATETAKGAKVTTREELFRGHEMLPRTEQGAIILTDELFRNLAASHTYKYNGRVFKVLEKRSGTEKGGKTLYKVQSGADLFTDFSIEELKHEFGCEFRRAKDGSSNAKSPLGKAKYATDKLAEVIAECNDEELTKAYQQLKGLVGLKRAEEQKREQEEKEQREKAEKEQRERERADKNADKMSDAVLLAELKKRGLI